MTHFSISEGAGTPCGCGWTSSWSADWLAVDCIDCLREVCLRHEKTSEDNARLREALNSKRDWVTISALKGEIARLREAIKAAEDRLRDQFTYIEGQTWASHTRELRVIADALKVAREGR